MGALGHVYLHITGEKVNEIVLFRLLADFGMCVLIPAGTPTSLLVNLFWIVLGKHIINHIVIKTNS